MGFIIADELKYDTGDARTNVHATFRNQFSKSSGPLVDDLRTFYYSASLQFYAHDVSEDIETKANSSPTIRSIGTPTGLNPNVRITLNEDETAGITEAQIWAHLYAAAKAKFTTTTEDAGATFKATRRAAREERIKKAAADLLSRVNPASS